MTVRPPWSGAGAPGGTPASPLGARFRLEEQIGTDKDATVWQATDALLRRTVTIHVLAPRPRDSAFADAVRAAARLADPRLARIFDADYDGECPYVVSEYAPGETVEELLSAGALSPHMAAAIVSDAADALGIAHQAGLAHLCLGPRSVRWGTSGVKITGLGIEAALRHAQASDPAAADTCALARILYALLTGYWPGTEPTTLPPAPQRRDQWPAPCRIQADVPAALSAVTRRALHAETSRSPISTPAQFAQALRLATRPPAAPTRFRGKRHAGDGLRASRPGSRRRWRSAGEDAAGQEVRRLQAHEVVPRQGGVGRDQAVSLAEAGALQCVTDASGIGEPRQGHPAGQVVTEDRFSLG